MNFIKSKYSGGGEKSIIAEAKIMQDKKEISDTKDEIEALKQELLEERKKLKKERKLMKKEKKDFRKEKKSLEKEKEEMEKERKKWKEQVKDKSVQEMFTVLNEQVKTIRKQSSLKKMHRKPPPDLPDVAKQAPPTLPTKTNRARENWNEIKRNVINPEEFEIRKPGGGSSIFDRTRKLFEEEEEIPLEPQENEPETPMPTSFHEQVLGTLQKMKEFEKKKLDEEIGIDEEEEEEVVVEETKTQEKQPRKKKRRKKKKRIRKKKKRLMRTNDSSKSIHNYILKKITKIQREKEEIEKEHPGKVKVTRPKKKQITKKKATKELSDKKIEKMIEDKTLVYLNIDSTSSDGKAMYHVLNSVLPLPLGGKFSIIGTLKFRKKKIYFIIHKKLMMQTSYYDKVKKKICKVKRKKMAKEIESKYRAYFLSDYDFIRTVITAKPKRGFKVINMMYDV